MARAEVTVVIPTRDRWELLTANALRAALAQEDVDLEVVVVDDGSRDRPAADVLADERVRIIRNERPLGVAAARNAGLAAATGEWVAFLDDDDLWAPSKLRGSLAAAERACAAFAYSGVLVVDARGTPLAAYPPQDPAGLVRALLRANALGGPANVVMRRELAQSLGGFDEHLYVLEDWDMWIRAALAGAAAANADLAVAFVKHGRNSSVVNQSLIWADFDRLVAKHEDAAVRIGVRPDPVAVTKWMIGETRQAAGPGAAIAAVRAAVEHRRPKLIAAGLGWDRARLTRASLPRPDWLDAYRRDRPRRDGKAIRLPSGARWAVVSDRMHRLVKLDPGTPATAVRRSAGDPAVLAVALEAMHAEGVLAARREEARLRRLVRALRAIDPELLVLCAVAPPSRLRLGFADGLVVPIPGADPLSELAEAHALAEELPVVADLTGAAGDVARLARTARERGCAGVIVPGEEHVEAAEAGDGPLVSVIVCTHNGEATLGECLDGVGELDYPEGELIVVDDGSTDGSAEIAEAAGAHVIRLERVGLGQARNAGVAAARGEVVAFLDDDARPHPDWLAQLVAAFDRDDVAGAGGPNLGFPGDGLVAACAAGAPGRANYLMRGALEAEHLAGVNMAFRREALESVGGFDPLYVAAGDEVDVCRRLRGAGWRLACAPGAVVFHHFRPTVRDYLRQQWRNGRAEALVAARSAGDGPAPPAGPAWPRPLAARALPTKPYVVALLLALLRRRAALAVLAVLAADRASATAPSRGLTARALTALFYLLQPLARLGGRVSASLGADERGARAAVPPPAAEAEATPPRPAPPRARP